MRSSRHRYGAQRRRKCHRAAPDKPDRGGSRCAHRRCRSLHSKPKRKSRKGTRTSLLTPRLKWASHINDQRGDKGRACDILFIQAAPSRLIVVRKVLANYLIGWCRLRGLNPRPSVYETLPHAIFLFQVEPDLQGFRTFLAVFDRCAGACFCT